MLKNSGTQEKGKITYQKYANDAVKFISCGKIKNLIFQKNIFSCYPLEKRLFKKLTYFLNSPFLCSVRDGE